MYIAALRIEFIRLLPYVIRTNLISFSNIGTYVRLVAFLRSALPEYQPQ